MFFFIYVGLCSDPAHLNISYSYNNLVSFFLLQNLDQPKFEDDLPDTLLAVPLLKHQVVLLNHIESFPSIIIFDFSPSRALENSLGLDGSKGE